MVSSATMGRRKPETERFTVPSKREALFLKIGASPLISG